MKISGNFENDAARKPGNRPEGSYPPAEAWERMYVQNGKLWGGVPFPIQDLPAGSRVIELGCGNGKLIASLAQKTYDCCALDFSAKACRLARDAVNNPAVTILAADARRIPLRSFCIDAVVAHHIAGHLLEGARTALFQEAARVLRHRGRFFFCDFSERDFRVGQGVEIEERTFLRGNGIITHYFTEDEVRLLANPLCINNLTTVSRPMAIRGKLYNRAEIVALLHRA